MSALKSFFSGIYNLVIGLLVTGKHLGRHAITLQYPKERWEMPERSRGVVVLLTNPETGELNCTSCLLCMKACPSSAIIIEREKNPETKKWQPIKFVIDNTICCFCGMCEEACNFDAIKLAGQYEMSVYNQSELIYDMDKLTELGRNVKYTPRLKKKPIAKKKPVAEKTAVKPEGQKDTPDASQGGQTTSESGGKVIPDKDNKPDKEETPAGTTPIAKKKVVAEDRAGDNKPVQPNDSKQVDPDLDKNKKKDMEN